MVNEGLVVLMMHDKQNAHSRIDWIAPLEHLYAAVGIPDAWNILLDELCVLLHARSALLFTPCPQMLDLPYHHSSQYSIDTARDYIECFVHEDAYNAAAISKNMFTMGMVATGDDLVPLPELRRTRFYNEFLLKHHQGNLLASIPYAPDNQFGLAPMVLSFYRPADHMPFGQAEVDCLNRLMPHIQRAWLLHNQILYYKSLHVQLQMVLDQLSHGLIIVGGDQQVRFANAIAKQFLSAVYLRDVAASRQSVLGLPEAVVNMLKYRQDKTVACARLRLDSNQQWYVVATRNLFPVGNVSEYAGLVDATTMTIWVIRGCLENQYAVDLMAQFFSLTPAEANVLRYLLQGVPLKKISMMLGVSQTTIRSHVNAMLDKTLSARQQDLIHLASQFEFLATI